MMAETLGYRLKHARDQKVLTIAELAESAAVSKPTIINIEKDRFSRTPNRATVRKLAAALGVDPGWLLTGDASPGSQED
jgi:transcriptional regulator with XRE-family HTH domain